MKISKIFAVVTAMAAMMSMASCSDDKKTSEGTGENSIIRYDKPTEAPTAAPTEAVEAASDGPRLSIKDTTVKAGEVAEVTIAIENAEAAWNMCGFHITYPEELIPEMMDAEERLVRKKMGEASEYNAGSVAMEKNKEIRSFFNSACSREYISEFEIFLKMFKSIFSKILHGRFVKIESEKDED